MAFWGYFSGTARRGIIWHHGRRGGSSLGFSNAAHICTLYMVLFDTWTWPKDAGNDWGITVSRLFQIVSIVLSWFIMFYPSFRTAMNCANMGLPKSRGNKRWFWESAEYSSSPYPKWSHPLIKHPDMGSRWPNEYVRKTAPFHLVVFNLTIPSGYLTEPWKITIFNR